MSIGSVTPKQPSNSVWAEIQEHFGEHNPSIDEFIHVNLDFSSDFKYQFVKHDNEESVTIDNTFFVDIPIDIDQYDFKNSSNISQSYSDEISFEDLDSIAGILDSEIYSRDNEKYAYLAKEFNSKSVDLKYETLYDERKLDGNMEFVAGKLKYPKKTEIASENFAISKLKKTALVLIAIHISSSIILSNYNISIFILILLNYIGIFLIIYFSYLVYDGSSFSFHGLRAHVCGFDLVYSYFDSKKTHVEMETIEWDNVNNISLESKILRLIRLKNDFVIKIKFSLSKKMICGKSNFFILIEDEEGFEKINYLYSQWKLFKSRKDAVN